MTVQEKKEFKYYIHITKYDYSASLRYCLPLCLIIYCPHFIGRLAHPATAREEHYPPFFSSIIYENFRKYRHSVMRVILSP